jgi:glycosyltransferase involved in cell wall biosynthesis
VARAIARRCTAVVGISEAVLGTFDGLNGAAIHLVRSGVPAYRVDRVAAGSALRRELGAPAGAPVVAQVGQIVPNKGQLDTIEVIPAVLARNAAARFVFVGEPDTAAPGYKHEVEARARALGVDRAISFLGYRDDAVRLIAGADALVVPSLQLPGFYGWREGFGLVAAEAMAVGTPVVAYDDPALVETLAGAGVVVPSGDREALAAALNDLLDHPGRRARLADAGRRRAEQLRFDRAVAELSAVYERVGSHPR